MRLCGPETVKGEDRTSLPLLSIHTKNSDAGQVEIAYLTGRPVDALNAWLSAAKIDSNSVFLAINRWGHVSRRAIDPKAVNDIVKQRVRWPGSMLGSFRRTGCSQGI